MDPSTSTAREGRPPPAAPWPACFALVIADVTLLDVGGRLVAIAILAAVGAAASIVEGITFGRQAVGVDGLTQASARIAWLRERRRPALIALLMLGTLALVGAALVSAPLVTAAAGWTGVPVFVAALIAALVGGFAWASVVIARPRALVGRGISHPACAWPLATMQPLVRLVLPLAATLAGIVDRIRARRRSEAEPISVDDMRGLAEGEEAGEPLAEEEAALIHSILEFSETTVREVMVAREDMVALVESATLNEALSLIREAGHSRYPLYGESLDDIRGVVYAKDLLPMAGTDPAAAAAFDLNRIARPARFASPDRNLDDQLADFRAQRTHLAIVTDELGSTIGLVTLEDLLEEVVGEIRDELDEPDHEPRLVTTGPGAYSADARLDLNVFFGALGIEVDPDMFAFETVGGLVFHLAGAVPEEGDEVTFDRLRLRVESLEANRIREVSVRLSPDTH